MLMLRSCAGNSPGNDDKRRQCMTHTQNYRRDVCVSAHRTQTWRSMLQTGLRGVLQSAPCLGLMKLKPFRSTLSLSLCGACDNVQPCRKGALRKVAPVGWLAYREVGTQAYQHHRKRTNMSRVVEAAGDVHDHAQSTSRECAPLFACSTSALVARGIVAAHP